VLYNIITSIPPPAAYPACDYLHGGLQHPYSKLTASMTIDREAAVAEVEGWGFKKAFTYKDTLSVHPSPIVYDERYHYLLCNIPYLPGP
jgi:hypothetical protein